MKEAGKKTDYRTHPLKSVSIEKTFDGLATCFPPIPEDHTLLCVFDTWGANDGTEKMYICETLEDINQLLNRYHQGYALNVSFAMVSKAHFANEEILSRENLVALMKSSASEEEWNRNCQIVKSKFNGNYPPFWFSTIVLSGVLQDTQRNWSQPNTSSTRLSFISTVHDSSPSVSSEEVSEEQDDNRCRIS